MVVNWCMKNSILSILIVLLPLLSIGQSSDLFAIWPDTIIAKANSAQDVEYMTEEEKLAVFYINLVRTNPPLFANTYLKDYMKENGIKKDKEVKSLIDELEATKPRVMLQPSESLTQLAREHANDMGETGRTGHKSSDGTSFKDRMVELSKTFSGINENCNYGHEGGIDAAIDLLIDRNVPNVGHRRNILDPQMRFAGIAIEPHKRWRFNCVQDFGGKKLD